MFGLVIFGMGFVLVGAICIMIGLAILVRGRYVWITRKGETADPEAFWYALFYLGTGTILTLGFLRLLQGY